MAKDEKKFAKKGVEKKIEVYPESIEEDGSLKAVPASADRGTVALEYKKANHHFLDHVYCVVKGVNHVPKWVWEKARKQPAVAQLIKDGSLVELDDAK